MPTPDFVSRKREIRRGLVRSHTATGVVLVVTLLLAVAAVFYALTAEKNAEAARVANRRMRGELWKARLAEATAWRLSSRAGRRSQGLKAIAQAARLRPALELRNEALATLPLADTRSGAVDQAIAEPDIVCAFAPGRGLQAWGDVKGRLAVRRVGGTNDLASYALPHRIMAVAFSRDERWLAAYSQGGALRVGDPLADPTQLQFAFPAGDFNEHALDFHPANRLLAVCTPEEQVRFIDLAAGEELPALQLGGPPSVAVFDPAGTRLAVASGTQVRVFRYPTFELTETIETPDRVLDLDWHPDGGHLAGACREGRILLIAANGKSTLSLRGHTGLASQVFFDPTGEVLISTSWDGTTRFWAAGSGWPLFVNHTGFARQFDLTGTRLFYHKEGTGLGEWEFLPATGLRTPTIPLDVNRSVFGIDFSPDGLHVAAATQAGVFLWNSQSGRPVGELPLTWVQGVAFAQDGETLLTSSYRGLRRTGIQRTPDGRAVFTGQPRRVEGWTNGGLGLGFVAHGEPRRFLSCDGQRVVVADLASPDRVRSLKFTGWPSSVTVSPDARTLVTSVWKGYGTRVWDLESEQFIRRLPDEGGMATFSPNGRRLAVGTAKEFVLYDTSDWRPLRHIARDAASALSGLVAFSPDGRCLALTPTLRQIRLFSADGAGELATLEAPSPERITALCFSPDSRRLAAATDNGVVQVWDLPRLREALAELGLDWGPEASVPPEHVAMDGADSSSRTVQMPLAPPATTARDGPGQSSPSAAAAESASARAAAIVEAGQSPSPDDATEFDARARRRSLRVGAPWLSGGGAALGMLFAIYSLRHHRRLVDAYETVEALAQRRRQALESAQAQLVHSQKMTALGTLAAGVAHDFNNLLSIIRMAGQLVRRQLRPTGGALENLDAIEQAVQQGKSIAHSILGYSRRPGDPNQVYRVSEVVSETLSMLNKQYLSGIVLTLEQDPEAPSVRGDKNRLEQVLLNLIVNAVEAMQAHGKLTLGVRGRTQGSIGGVLPARPAGRYVEVTVADTGTGIPPELRTRIFEPFFTTKQSGGEHGTGLGLTTVYNIACDEGWGLELDTEPGRGTTFRVLLPAADANPVKPGGRDLPIPPGVPQP